MRSHARRRARHLVLLLISCLGAGLGAQEHRVFFRTDDPGVTKAISVWGVDTSWPSEANMRAGLVNMGPDQIDMVRMCFFVDEPLTDTGQLGEKTRQRLGEMMSIAQAAGDKPWTLMPATESGVHAWYKDGAHIRVERWVQAIEATQRFIGKRVAIIEAFNEPDYGWGQTTAEDLHEILRRLKANPAFSETRLAGPSTLNSEQALRWYRQISDTLSIGTTHCLAGSFGSYIDFLKAVQANGQAVQHPEAHSVAEAITGAEYGLEATTWWGPPTLPRGHFVQDCQGKRLAYVEDPQRWTAAAVYRSPSGVIRAFLGAAERQAQPTTFRLVCGDRAVWFNGIGPAREYAVRLGPHDEEFVDITFGEAIPQHLDGEAFVIMNRKAGAVLELAADKALQDGAAVNLRPYSGDARQTWDVARVRHGYYTIVSAVSGKTVEVADWDPQDGALVRQWGDGQNELQRWSLEDAGRGAFYIRNEFSGKYMSVPDDRSQATGDVVQQPYTGAAAQQWRFVPADATPDEVAPAAPSGLSATPHTASMGLSWQPSSDGDAARYTVYRAPKPGGPYDAVGTTTTCAFTDPAPARGAVNGYAVRATDRAWNHSPLSAAVEARPAEAPALVACLSMDGDLADSSDNGNAGAMHGTAVYERGRHGKALVFDGQTGYVSLPAGIASWRAVTIAAWVRWHGGPRWQRVFEFSNDTKHYLFLTPLSDASTLRFAMQNGGGDEQRLNAPALATKRWTHVAVVLGEGEARLFVDGRLADSAETTVTPAAIGPVCLRLGKSTWDDPLFAGLIDDFRIYNHALPEASIADLAKR